MLSDSSAQSLGFKGFPRDTAETLRLRGGQFGGQFFLVASPVPLNSHTLPSPWRSSQPAVASPVRASASAGALFLPAECLREHSSLAAIVPSFRR